MIRYILTRIREFRCEHEWEQLHRICNTDEGEYIGTTFFYRCTKCGMERKYECE